MALDIHSHSTGGNLMADITITVNDLHIQRALTAISARFQYDTNKLEGESRGAFAKRMIADWLKRETKRYEDEVSRVAAAAGVEEIEVT
jgi:hypothetical protein